MATREPIYSALAALVFGNPGVQALFVTTGRYLIHHEQLPAGGASCPAIYLIETAETHYRQGRGISDRRVLHCSFCMYFYAPKGVPLPATQINNGMDALDDCLNNPGTPDNTQTLGGLVNHVYMEGTMLIAENLLQDFAIVRADVTIMVP